MIRPPTKNALLPLLNGVPNVRRLVSAPMLIAVAFSGICGLMVPRLKTAVLYLRFIFILAAGLLGLYGVLIVSVALLIHVTGLTSFGVDMTLSLMDISFQGLKDSPIRASWTKMLTRPALQNRNRIRMKNED